MLSHRDTASGSAAFHVSHGKSASRLDHFSLTIVILLLLGGAVSVYSASMAHAMDAGSMTHFLLRHMLRMGVGLVLMLVLASVDYRVWSRLAWPMGIVSLVLLGLTLTQAPINGAQRWLTIAGVSFQPIDVAKFGFLLIAAVQLSKIKDWSQDRGKLLPVLVLFVLTLVVLALQPNKSLMIGLTGSLLLMLFIAGIPWSWILAGFGAAAAGFATLLMAVSNSNARIMSWLQSLSDPMAGSSQQVQAMIALGRGGWVGQGPGNSMQKLFYVAEPFNDFIFAIFGEEWGFFGCLLVVLLYLGFFLRAMQIIRRSQDPFARMLAMGIAGIFFMHAIINMYVATGLFPVTGQTLPLFSYGGTSLITMLGAIGILLNISYQARSLEPGRRR